MNKGYSTPKREHARGDWGKGVGKKKVGKTKSGSSAPLEKKTRASGLPSAKGGWPESPLGKPKPSKFHDPNPGMGGVHGGGAKHEARRAMRKAASGRIHRGKKG